MPLNNFLIEILNNKAAVALKKKRNKVKRKKNIFANMYELKEDIRNNYSFFSVLFSTTIFIMSIGYPFAKI